VDDELCRLFFLQPQQTVQRRYEALRAYFLDGRPLADIAAHFGYRRSSLKSLVCRFRATCGRSNPAPFFFRTVEAAPPVDVASKTAMGPNSPRPRTSGS
jgi:helix-turn-helix protein